MTDAPTDQPAVSAAEAPIELPDPLSYPMPEFLDWVGRAAPAEQWQVTGEFLLRLVDYIRELEERLEEPIDETPIRRAERDRLARWFESTDIRAYVGQDGISCEFVAFLLRLDHSASS